jgi:hypothetical protein
VIDRLAPHLPFLFIKIHRNANGTYPNGVPNPMLEETAADHGHDSEARGGYQAMVRGQINVEFDGANIGRSGFDGYCSPRVR